MNMANMHMHMCMFNRAHDREDAKVLATRAEATRGDLIVIPDVTNLNAPWVGVACLRRVG